jgi:hypothetical protein
MATPIAKIPLIQVHPVDMTIKVKFKENYDDHTTEQEEIQKDPGGDIERSLRIYREFRRVAEQFEWETVRELKKQYGKCLTGAALSNWRNIVNTTPDVGNGFEEAVMKYKRTFLSLNDYHHQKLYMETMKKPDSMDPLTFHNRLVEMVAFLREFPRPDGIPPLREDETTQMFFKAMPAYYQRALQMANLNPYTMHVNDMVQYIVNVYENDNSRKRRNETDDRNNHNNNNNNNDSSQKSNKKQRFSHKGKNGGSNGQSGKRNDNNHKKKKGNCRLHPNGIHDWEDCYANKKSKNYKPGFKPKPVEKQEDGYMGQTIPPAPSSQTKTKPTTDNHWMDEFGSGNDHN